MAFGSPDSAFSTTPASKEAADASVSSDSNLNDDNTGTTAAVECRLDMGSYKITHDLGFALANLDTLSIQIFDGQVMTSGSVDIYPYDSGDSSIVTGNEVNLTINDNGAYDTVALTAGFISDLGDVGTNQISIRVASAGVRFRANEIQIEFAEAAGDGDIVVDPLMGPGIIPFPR